MKAPKIRRCCIIPLWNVLHLRPYCEAIISQNWWSALPAPSKAPSTSSLLAPMDQRVNGQQFFPRPSSDCSEKVQGGEQETFFLILFLCLCRDPFVHKDTRKFQLSCTAKASCCNQLGLATHLPPLTHPGFAPTRLDHWSTSTLADMAEHRLDLLALMCTGIGTWQQYSKYLWTYFFRCWKNASHSSKETSKSCCTLLSLHCPVCTAAHQQKQQLPSIAMQRQLLSCCWVEHQHPLVCPLPFTPRNPPIYYI